MQVLVIGGGAVGLCCAWSLARRGAEVTVVDRGRFGAATSAGNAGWITPALSTPLAAPGVVGQSLRWMLDPESPLYVRLRPSLLGFGLRFVRAARPAASRAGTEAVLRLAARAPEDFDALLAAGVEFEHHTDGMLYLARDEPHLDELRRMYESLAELGYADEVSVLRADELRSFEPAVGPDVHAGLFGPRERHVRPESLCAGLVSALRGSATLLEDTRVVSLSPGWTAASSAGDLRADAVIVAAGVWSSALLRPLGYRLPMVAAKGYSVTVRAGDERPRRPLYMSEAKVGASPFEGGWRLAGTLELGGDDSLNPVRIEAMVRAARPYLRGWRAEVEQEWWAGLRPLAPDGVPVVGAVPGHAGLFVATAHAMLGITLAPSTGEALAGLVLSGSASELGGLSPGRFR